MPVLLRLLQSTALGLVVLSLIGCSTTNQVAEYDRASAEPQTYAVVLFIAEGEELAPEDREFAMTFARDTLLASGLVYPGDVMIDDIERADMLFRARIEGGQLTEIAAVPGVTNSRSVVLSSPRRIEDRIYWDDGYYTRSGYPGYYEGIHSGFPIPAVGYGIARSRHHRDGHRNRDRDKRNRNRDRDKADDRPADFVGPVYRGDNQARAYTPPVITGNRSDSGRDRDRPRPPAGPLNSNRRNSIQRSIDNMNSAHSAPLRNNPHSRATVSSPPRASAPAPAPVARATSSSRSSYTPSQATYSKSAPPPPSSNNREKEN